MLTPAARFEAAIPGWFRPGALYTFVGAGGKSTAIKRIAGLLAQAGVIARMSTTTRVGVEEFSGTPVRTAGGQEELARAVNDQAPLLLVACGTTTDGLKYTGIDSRLLDALPVPNDAVILVEGDGSRGLPMKVPRDHEPVIPESSSAVFAVVGASAFDRRIDADSCYNHAEALALLEAAGKSDGRFTAESIAALAAHPRGFRKGVLPHMRFMVLLNQGDLVEHRQTALAALSLMQEIHGLESALVSFQKGELYGATE